MPDIELKKQIAEAEAAVKAAEAEIAKAKAAGIDTAEFEEALDKAKANLEKLKTVYGK